MGYRTVQGSEDVLWGTGQSRGLRAYCGVLDSPGAEDVLGRTRQSGGAGGTVGYRPGQRREGILWRTKRWRSARVYCGVNKTKSNAV